MSKKSLDLTRRRFMAVSSAAIAAPILKNMVGIIPDAKAAEKRYDFVDRKSCDLVVLGGGGSGLVAAVRAAQLSGKKVIVLEKDSIAGGGMQYARTVRIFGSKWQAKRNIPDTTAAYAKEMMEWMYWWLDEELVKSCLHGTGQFFDWLCEQGGDIEDKFTAGKYVFAHGENEPVGPQMEDVQPGEGFGRFVTDMMIEKCKTYGVEVLTEHPVVDVEVNRGKIVAAIAKSDAGYVRVECKACVLATGSWIRNAEIMKKYVPKFYEVMEATGMNKSDSNAGHTSINYTGDGIPLAEKVGAFIDYDSFVIRPMGPMSRGTRSLVFRAMAQSPFIVTVNKDGKRYACESVVMNLGIFNSGSVLTNQPDGQACDIFDENTIAAAFKYNQLPESEKEPEKEGVDLTPGYNVYLPDTMEEVRNDLKENSSSIIMADSLEELADKIGVNKNNFLETIKKYNEDCEKGIDAFFKNKRFLAPINKAPYYASKGSLATDGAFGGVLVNHEMQAYKSDRTSLVEGLYVTGDFASGRHVNVNDVKWQVLNDFSWALSSGFLAGTNVAKYLESL